MMNMQQAGLGAAIGAPQKQGQDLSGMLAMMNMLKDVPDQTLADVLAGKPVHLNIDGTPTPVPQFAAMLAAQGRQELRTAMAGQQAPQPSIKDQLLSAEQQAANPQSMIVPPQQGMASPQQGMASPQQMEQGASEPQAGLDQIPALNMQNMAGGGIIAFEAGGTPADRRKDAIEAINQGMPETAPSDLDMSISDYYNLKNKAVNAVNKNIPMPMPLSNEAIKAYQSVYGRVPEQSPLVASKTAEEKPLVNTKPPVEGGLDSILKAKNVAPAAAPAAAGPKIMSLEDTQKIIQEDPTYQSINKTISGLKDKHNRFQAMLDEHVKQEPDRKKEIEDVKNQGIGQYMMNMGAALLGNPQFGKAIQEGNTVGLAALNMSRKEVKELQKDYRDYNLSLTKSAEATEQGNQELAQKYQANAIQLQNSIGENVYRANQSAIGAYKAPFENELHSSQASYYRQLPSAMANRYTDPNLKYEKITPAQAGTAWEKMSRTEKEKLRFQGVYNPIQYQQYWNSGGQPLLLNSLPEGGSTLKLKPQ